MNWDFTVLFFIPIVTSQSCTDAGYYCDGATVTICPAGSFCPSGQTSKTDCDPQEYQIEIGSSSGCNACNQLASEYLKFYQCTSSSSIEECDYGEYTSTSTLSCTPCPAGFACTVGFEPVACLSNKYSPEGFMDCFDFADLTDGQYIEDNNIKNCNTGSSCVSGVEDTSPPCPKGQYDNAGSCSDCPEGSICDGASNTDCSGASDATGLSVCENCSTNYLFRYDSTANTCSVEQFLTGQTAATLQTIIASVTANNCANQNKISRLQLDNTAFSPECDSCPEGTYYSTSSFQCVECPEDQACAIDSQPAACAANTYSAGGLSVCLACENGIVDTDGNCKACPPGTKYNSAGPSCDVCPAGTFSAQGSLTCSDCPAGFYCPYANSNQPLTCPDGTYSSQNAESCTACDAGKSCSKTSVSDCIAGTYSPEGNADCLPCPENAVCVAGAAEPNECESGTYADSLTNTCKNCDGICPGPIYVNNVNAFSCPDGHYKVQNSGNTLSCMLCPAGYECTTDKANPTPCEPGTFSKLGKDTCENCPDGFECSIFGVGDKCAFGTYSDSGECKTCPNGQNCGGNIPQVCTNGIRYRDFYLSDDQECVECPAGYSCSNGLATICAEGTYSYPNDLDCSNCIAGYLCSVGSENPSETPCPPGYYCEVGTTPFGGSKPPVKCSIGNYIPSTRATQEADCMSCPEGFLCSDAGDGVSELSDGYFCNPGYYCESGATSEQACPTGTYQPYFNQKLQESCLDCPIGTYQPSEAQTECIICPAGSVCSESALESPVPCNEGYYSTSDGLTNQGDCIVCPTGHWCSVGVKNPCPAGKFNEQVGASSEVQCSDCPAGKICSTTGLSAPDESCQPGYYCLKGQSVATENACMPGTFTNNFNASYLDSCSDCPSGKICGSGSGGNSSTGISDCPEGFYCPGGSSKRVNSNSLTFNDGRIPCPSGTYNDVTGLSSYSECKPCPPGKYCDEQTVNPEDCVPGFYCPQGTNSSSTFPCPAGTFNNINNAYRVENCTACSAGAYCPLEIDQNKVPTPSTAPTNCNPGFYNSNTGESTENACLPCPSGYECPNEGTTEPTICLPGFYSKWSISGTSSCSPCEAGYYCHNSGTTAVQMRSLYLCPSGMFCPQGTSTKPDLTSNACSEGNFCPEATPEEISCPPGTYSNVTGLVSSNKCSVCPGGYYCTGGDWSTVILCEEGFYCPGYVGTNRLDNSDVELKNVDLIGNTYTEEGTLGRPWDHQPCPPGFLGYSTGATSLDSCSECPAGFYWLL